MENSAAQDPAGLLQRIVELQPLCADPAVRRAVATGDAFKVYRALWWARLRGRLGAHRRTLDALLQNRRAFARPLGGKTPSLGRVNGFGTALLGHAEVDTDGSHIATHAFVVLFVLPLFPLGAYVVHREASSGLSTSWRIFARVPLGTAAWLWRRAVAAGVVLAVLAGAVSAFHSSRHHDLWVVNGFDRPLHVTVGPATLDLPPGAEREVNLPVGTHPARATAGGATVDEGPLRVEAGSDVLVWNVGGAAPVMEYSVVYYRGAAPRDNSKPTIHCGERRIALRGIDYAFAEPPSGITLPRGTSRSVRRGVKVGQGADGVEAPVLCSYLLFEKQAWPQAASVLEARARVHGWPADDAGRAVWAAQKVSKQEELRIARAARDARPADVDLHRLYQTVARSAGGTAALREEYRARAAAAPDDPHAQYLLTRILPEEEQLAASERLLQRFPDDPDILRLVAGDRFDAGDWDGADRAWRTLRERAPAKAGQRLDLELVALVQLRREAEALALVEALFPALEGEAQASAAVLYAQLAQRSGAQEAGRLLARVKDADLGLLLAQAGLAPAGGKPSELEQVTRAAATDPARALKALAAIPTVALAGLDGETRALLHAEALRAGDALGPALDGLSHQDADDLKALHAYVQGAPGARFPLGQTPTARAAAEFVRSRNATLPEAERATLREAALRDDVLGTVITRAVNAWPAPAR